MGIPKHSSSVVFKSTNQTIKSRIGMRSLKLLLVWSITFLSSSAHNQETCEEEIGRERSEDWKNHACRSCKTIVVDAQANCPPMGFHCDPDLPMHTSTLTTDSCDCSQIRCADTNATLSVGAELVFKVTCSDQKWVTSKDATAVSAVCARKCGVGICSILPSTFFSTNPTLIPFAVNSPDKTHPCAWGSCSDGATAFNSDKLSGEVSFDGSVEFSCTGYRNWELPDGNRYKHVACKKETCKALEYDNKSELCGETADDQYSCYAPQFKEDHSGNAEKTMQCDEPNDLRTSSTNEVVKPMCSLGKWTNNGVLVDNDTKVMCLTCPIARLDPIDPVKPIVHGNQKSITCPSRDLVLTLYRSPTSGAGDVKVDSLRCTEEHVWEATLNWEITGHEFTKFSSLSEAVKDGVFFGVLCRDL